MGMLSSGRSRCLLALVASLMIGCPTALGQVVTNPQQILIPVEQEDKKETAAKKDEPQPVASSEVRVSDYMTVDIIAQHDRITNVLQKLAVQSRRNIVPAANVDKVVNATMYGVPFYDALDGLLHPNGLGYIERGEFIYVYNAADLQVIEQDSRPLVSRVIHLDYLRAADAQEFAQRLLSDDGTILATRDLGGDGGGGGGGDSGGGAADLLSSGSDEDAVYTPKSDEFALTNAIVVHDYREHVDQIEAFIREVDTRPAQILIEATIIQTNLTEANAFGVDFALLSGVDFTDFFTFPMPGIPLGFKTRTDDDGNVAQPTLPSREPFVVADPGNTGNGPATVRGGYIHDDVGVFIRALDQVTDVTLLSNPKVLALNRQRARVLVGTKVGYLETTVVENQVLQTVKFLDTGIELDIRPYILRDGQVRLELAPKVSEVVFREVEGTSGIVQQIPDEQLQTVNTDVLVPAGFTAVIGGLFREDSNRTRSQVPVLGDIPLVGAAFQGHDDNIERVEIIFLIKATVMKEKVVVDTGRRGEEYGERVRVGSRLGLLPWSRERQSSTLNLEAERLARAGKYDQALWKIRRSLELHPLQPEAIRIREKLVTEAAWWPSRSYMQRAIDEEFEAQLDVFVPPADEPADEGVDEDFVDEQPEGDDDATGE